MRGDLGATRHSARSSTHLGGTSDAGQAATGWEAGAPNFITLGPAGSCHERATRRYIEAMRLPHATSVTFVDDLVAAMEGLCVGAGDFIVQCSAHLNVHEVTERRSSEIHVIDTFMCPTRPIAILARTDVSSPRTIGVPHAAVGYLAGEDWDEMILETTKPVVAHRLLDGAYDAGLTNYEQLEAHPDELRLVRYVGEVQTTWLVYGSGERDGGAIVVSSGACAFWKTIGEGRWTR